jgi:serine protease Do
MKTRNIVVIFLVTVFSAFFSVLIYSKFFQVEQKPIVIEKFTQPTKFTGLSPASAVNFNFTAAAEKSIHAVVHVKTQYHQTVGGTYSLYDFFFGERGNKYYEAPVLNSGSGVIISDDGYIVTNNHVIESAEHIEITLNDKRSYKAKLIGTDPTTDIALLKIEEKGLSFISFGNSEELKVGEWVLAVGNPFNLTSTVTAGIVSAKARNINILRNRLAIEAFIQTDAAVNPGNSGGALVNINGDLIGINTAIASRTGSYSGYSFAVPVSIVKKVVSDIKEFGRVQRAILGVTITDINAKLAEELDIDRIEGIYITSVTENGAAKESGIRKGDVIVKIGNVDVINVPQLQEQISKFRPGDKIDVGILRDGKNKTILVEFKNMQGSTTLFTNESVSILGAKFEKVSLEEKRKLKINNGLKVIDPGKGKIGKAGVKEGFIITHVNREKVESLEDLQTVLQGITGGVYVEGLYPNGMTAYYAFGM